MPPLILDSLEIHNFRGLKELRIERLGRVNLLTGKNNVGKTSVLEALRLYAYPGSSELLVEILSSRDQYVESPLLTIALTGSPVLHLFYQGEATEPGRQSNDIAIGRCGLPEESMRVSVDSLGNGPLSPTAGRALAFRSSEYRLFVPLLALATLESARQQDNPDYITPATAVVRRHQSEHVPPVGLDHVRLGGLWDRIALTTQEDEVLRALRLIEPSVDRLILKPIEPGSQPRVPFVKLTGGSGPVSLRSLGDGMNRLFGIALAMVNAKDGFLLIDEVENGLHYTVQPDLWKLVFETSRRLNVQVSRRPTAPIA